MTLPLALLLLFAADAPDAETRVVEYLRGHVKPGRPVVVSELYNTVFTTPEERAVLGRLFNTFFKIPLFVVQHQRAAGRPPKLAELQEQFGFRVPGQAELMLRILESDPRVPKFLTRNAASGEIESVDVDAVLRHPKFGQALERTIGGWEGRPAPAWSLSGYDGAPVAAKDLAGRPYLLYFWFTNCPPCLKTTPALVELHARYAPRGFEIVAVNADRVLELPYSDADRTDYVQRLKAGFRVAHLTPAVQEAYGSVSVFPTSFLVDARGTVVKHVVNAPDMAALDAAVKALLGK